MKLVDSAETIFFLRRVLSTDDELWRQAEHDYSLSLKTCDSPNELLYVIQLDKEFLFPIKLRIATYERLIHLDRQDEYLRHFANYLRMHDPEWLQRANDLDKEAELLDENRSNNLD